MAQKRRQISAKTRVKLSQAAKKRKRGLKGTILGGRFMAGALTAAHRGIKMDIGDPGEGGGNPFDDIRGTMGQSRADSPKGAGGGHTGHRVKLEDAESIRAQAVDELGRAQRQEVERPGSLAREVVRRRLNERTGRTRVDPAKDDLTRVQMGHAPVKVRSAAVKDIQGQIREANWEKGQGAYETPNPKSPDKFIKDEMAPSHKEKFDQLMNDPNSEFWKGYQEDFQKGGPRPDAVNRRVRRYTDELQKGKSHQEALEAAGRGRGRPPGPAAPRGAGFAPKRKPAARKGRYESAQPRAREFNFGMSAQSVESFSSLKRRLPDDFTDDEIIRVQQWQREQIFADLQKNQKWAHETQRANILNQQGGKTKEDDDRVVFFTTNLGAPAPSVPADSLVGQYIIRKRKKMMQDAGVPKTQLRGSYPQAVRDMHLFERSFGLQYAAEGRQGAYKQSGWRYKNKSSRGYGKPTPIGSQIMYSSAGTPMYDAQGNIRYTEGATRPFRLETPLAGLRVFIG